jgi:hypothetical protein
MALDAISSDVVAAIAEVRTIFMDVFLPFP